MKKLFFPLLGMALFISCHSSLEKKDTQEMALGEPAPISSQEAAKQAPLSPQLLKDSAGTAVQFQQQASSKNIDWDKKIIKTAFLKLEVKDFKAYSGIVRKAAKQFGGYIANEDQNQTEEKIESTVSIKVPVEQFESIMDQLPSEAQKVVGRKITTDDVTGEVIDTKSRLEAKSQVRLKYLEFLKQSKNMGDVLKVQSEINGIQEEMESASGRINYLSHQSAFSTINLTFYQPFAGFNPVDNEPGFFTKSVAAFKSGFDSVTEILIGLISIWPFLLIIIAVWVVIKKFRVGISSTQPKS